jgi:hypothetical protein
MFFYNTCTIVRKKNVWLQWVKCYDNWRRDQLANIRRSLTVTLFIRFLYLQTFLPHLGAIGVVILLSFTVFLWSLDCVMTGKYWVKKRACLNNSFFLSSCLRSTKIFFSHLRRSLPRYPFPSCIPTKPLLIHSYIPRVSHDLPLSILRDLITLILGDK